MTFRLLAFAAALLLSATAAFGQAKTKTTLLLSQESAKPGETVTAGLLMRMPNAWHTYWKSPGESGIPTSIKWTLPKGVTAGEIQWPLPEKAIFTDLFTYEYHDEIILLIPLKLAADAPAGTFEIVGEVKWLECEAEGACIPGKSEVSASLKIGAESKPTGDAKELEDAKKFLPTPAAPPKLLVGWEKPATGDSRPLVLEWSVPGKPEKVDFYPAVGEADKWEVGHKTEVLPSEPGTARVRKIVKKKSEGGAWPAVVAGLFVHVNAGDKTGTAFETSVPIPGEAAGGAGTATATAAGAAFGEEKQSFAKMLWFAFIGGMILNIMPCVFPVIALKILGFVNQSKEDPRRVFHLGLIYSMGVVASFLVMAAVVLAVRGAGKDASWGMQMQNPQFTLVLTVLMTLVALNLFGLFEVTASGAVGAAGQLAQKEGAPGAFFNGILAVVLATPCTAPFLAPALGFAFAKERTAQEVILFFATTGLGLAFPYAMLSWKPAWVKLLPRPGAWMEKFKIAMGFPMLATALWLFSFTAKRFGSDGTLWLGLFLVIVAMAAWVFGEFVQRGTQRRGLAAGICLLLLGGGYAKVLESELDWRGAGKRGTIAWSKWSSEAIAKARAEGRVILVDFTAEWCLTCKANLRTSIDITSTRQKLKEMKAVTLIGDYTDEDPVILAELKRFGRAGVPLVLVYPKDASKPPVVMPQFITPGTMHGALDAAAK